MPLPSRSTPFLPQLRRLFPKEQLGTTKGNRVSQEVIEVLYRNAGLNARLSQEVIEVLQRIGVVVTTGGKGTGHGGGHKQTIHVVEIGALATARMAHPTVKGGFTVQSVAAIARAHMPPPAVSGGGNATVTAVAAKEIAKMAAILEKVIEGAPAAVAAARMASPVVSGGTGGATIQAVAARAMAAMAAPVISPPAVSPVTAATGGGLLRRRPPVKRQREKTVYVEAVPAIAFARAGRHIPIARDPEFDLEFEEFFAELLALDLIAA